MDNETRALRTALASFPRSGNTWLRYLIELATGEASGSVYDDRIMPRGRDGIVIKTHLRNCSEFDRAIHLVRNPFDAIESYFHWKRDIQGDASVDWAQHVRQSAVEWREHTLHWLSQGNEGSRDRGIEARSLRRLVRYEDLRANPLRELQGVLDWLGCDAADDACRSAVEQAALERMRALHPTLGAQFFRKANVGEGRSAFDDELVHAVTATLSDLLGRFGYDRIHT